MKYYFPPTRKLNNRDINNPRALTGLGDTGKGGMPGAMGGSLHPETGAALINLSEGGKLGAEMMMGNGIIPII
jgi:hypothetical protein